MNNSTTARASVLMSQAKVRIAAKYPFACGHLFRMEVEYTDIISTLATNGVKLKVNPDFFCDNSRENVEHLLHEWGHVALKHHLRRGDRNPQKWNRACDFALNGMFWESSIPIPTGALTKQRYLGKTAEQIYKRLKDKPEDQAPKAGEVEDHPDINNADTQDTKQEAQSAQEAKVDAENQEATGKLAGKGSIARALERNTSSGDAKVYWKDELREYISKKVKSDYSYSRRNIRMSRCSFIMPSLYSEQSGTFVIAVDTSISVSKKAAKKQATEMLDILETVLYEDAYIIWCDSKVCGVQHFQFGDAPGLKPKGGGGTNFEPPFMYVEDKGIEPEVLVYMTDGECSTFAPEPSYPVVWALTESQRSFNPPYGKVVKMY